MKIMLGDQEVGLGTYVDVNTEDATASAEDVMQGEVFYNAEGRQVGTHTCPTVDELLPELSNPATADKILSGYEAVDGTGNKLTGTSNAKVLPSLSNPAGSDHILAGYEAIDGTGALINGVMEKGINLSEMVNSHSKVAINIIKYSENKRFKDTPLSHSLGKTPVRAFIVQLTNGSVYGESVTIAIGSNTELLHNTNHKYVGVGQDSSGYYKSLSNTSVTFTSTTVTFPDYNYLIANTEYMLVTMA